MKSVSRRAFGQTRGPGEVVSGAPVFRTSGLLLLQDRDRSLGLVGGQLHIAGLARSLGLVHQRSGLGHIAARSLGRSGRPGARARSLDILVTARSLHVLVATGRLDVLVAARSLDILVATRSLDILVTARSLDVLVATGRLDILVTARSLHRLVRARAG